MSKKLVVTVVFTLFFVLITGYFYSNRALSFHFVDEEYNFTLGNDILHGQKIYKEQFSNHQPLAFVISAGIQKLTHPNSIFSLVKRHRQVMVAYAVVWSLILVSLFGLPSLVFVVIFELTKYLLLGDLFLPESLVVYPLIYLISAAMIRKGKLKSFEFLLIGFFISVIFFLLSPLWPLLLVLTIYFFKTSSKKVEDLKLFLIGALPITLVLIFFVDIGGYINQAIYINLFYFIPLTATDPTAISFLKGFGAPLITLFSADFNSQIFPVLWVLSLIFVLSVFRLIKEKRFKEAWFSVMLLGLCNLRYIKPGLEYYEGFHLLPWYACLIFMDAIYIVELFKEKSLKVVKLAAVTSVVLVVGLALRSSTVGLFVKTDQQHDLYVNYSNQTTLGEAVRIMSEGKKDDSLFVAPDEWLIYWQS